MTIEEEARYIIDSFEKSTATYSNDLTRQMAKIHAKIFCKLIMETLTIKISTHLSQHYESLILEIDKIK